MNVSADGLDALISAMDELERNADEIAKMAMYKGAGMLADEIRRNLNSLPVQEDANGEAPWGTPEHRLYGVTSAQKQDLLDGFGISRMQDEGGAITVSVGFHGNGSTKTPRHPDGVPNAQLMRAVESGSSFRQKRPTVRPAVNKLKKSIEQAMLEAVEEEIRKEI